MLTAIVSAGLLFLVLLGEAALCGIYEGLFGGRKSGK